MKINKKVIIISFIIVLLVLIMFSFSKPKDILSQLEADYKIVDVKETTLLDYESKKIFATTDDEKILLQIVKNVKQDSLVEVFKELTNKISETNKKFTYFDPYLAKTIEYLKSLILPFKLISCFFHSEGIWFSKIYSS